ncbi:hypothetical protein EGR_10830 [Echinococcus granulosus]|uniref:Uncharacterized protein n=1 Tax=Echinococcus granulosus TaxID=6210 RepID=W6U7F7_ECHGR|nr:hypothetical protein EGR_10830 [Echinococcus granulosus]EUB54307.1 hypothetical protein EGR_10830 [Echinococcus granulosus]
MRARKKVNELVRVYIIIVIETLVLLITVYCLKLLEFQQIPNGHPRGYANCDPRIHPLNIRIVKSTMNKRSLHRLIRDDRQARGVHDNIRPKLNTEHLDSA